MKTEMRICSSLEKIFSDGVLPEKTDSLYLMKNEKGGLLIAVAADRDITGTLSAGTDLETVLYAVKEIPSSLPIYPDAPNCTVLNEGKSGYYPDLLIETEGDVVCKAGKLTVFAAEFTGSVPGEHVVRFVLSGEGEELTAEATVTVAPTALPEQELLHTNWFHSDCLAVRYNVEVFSEEWWRITENYIRNAASHGVNLLLTPVFTPPLDTEVGGERPTVQLVDVYKKGYTYTFGFEKFDRWVDICLKAGIRAFEISHFFTQWGARHAPKIVAVTSGGVKKIFGWETDALSQGYFSFLRQFGAAFKEHTDLLGITDRCMVHCSDEPSLKDKRKYAKTSSALREYFSAYRHIDALSDYEFYKEGLIDVPVPSEDAIDRFAGKVDELWTYCCCGQYRNEMPNRFFCFPSIRNRILGVLLYKYNCRGFLQWGFNFWFTQHSKRPVDPFTETDAGGAFPSGDAFIVYPAKDGTPYSSLRQKVFRDAMQDVCALNALEKKTSREDVLALIEKHFGELRFSRYPLDNAVYLAFIRDVRERL